MANISDKGKIKHSNIQTSTLEVAAVVLGSTEGTLVAFPFLMSEINESNMN